MGAKVSLDPGNNCVDDVCDDAIGEDLLVKYLAKNVLHTARNALGLHARQVSAPGCWACKLERHMQLHLELTGK